MKKVIDGRLYNTETAGWIVGRKFGNQGDFSFYNEELYLTNKGTFFIHYHGGALSKYALSQGPHLVSGSEGIRVLDKNEALEWCQENEVDAEIIITYFDIEEG